MVIFKKIKEYFAGGDLLEIAYQNDGDLMLTIQDSLDKGNNPNIITKYKESALRVLSNNGRFDVIKLLLSRGADEKQLGWSNLHNAIAYGSISNLEEVVTNNCDLEVVDFWGRTPLLFSILVGDIEKTALLIEAGANVSAVGRCGKTPLSYATQKDDEIMLNWLVDHEFDLEQMDDFSSTPLMVAAEHNAIKCVRALINKGVNIFKENDIQEQAVSVASNVEIVTALINAGADINNINKESRAEMLGYRADEVPNISAEEYFKGRNRVFGKSNPEQVDNPFWLSMVKSGGSAYLAASKFDKKRDIFQGEPIWSYNRFGKSITCLQNGIFIEIAGEHEDSYDPDFCIYNDVFVHDGKGRCKIYTYPREIFPPTDFHTATLVEDYIYIIGSIGYEEDRKIGYTQVFRLNINSMEMERVETTGDMPGWIGKHSACFNGGTSITIKGGEILEEDYIDNDHEYSLCLESMEWKTS